MYTHNNLNMIVNGFARNEQISEDNQ